VRGWAAGGRQQIMCPIIHKDSFCARARGRRRQRAQAITCSVCLAGQKGPFGLAQQSGAAYLAFGLVLGRRRSQRAGGQPDSCIRRVGGPAGPLRAVEP